MSGINRLARHMTTIQRLRQHAISSGAPRVLVTRADALLEDVIRVIYYARTATIGADDEMLVATVPERPAFEATCIEGFIERLHAQTRGK